MDRIATIARYTALEALRTRLPILLIAALALTLCAAFFVSGLAVIEGSRFLTSFYAAASRLAVVFIVAAHVLASLRREFDDKGLDVFLALDLPRSHYILGKIAGYVLIAMCAAILASLPLLVMPVPMVACVQWLLALALELAVVAAFALFCAMAFGQFSPAAALTFAFYLLARSLTAIQLISAHPLSGADTLTSQLGRWTADTLALVMPALDRWPQTAWLIDAPLAWSAHATLLLQGALYVALLTGAAMVDFQRRNF